MSASPGGRTLRPHDLVLPPSDPPYIPLWLLALITASGTLAVHIFVPALPDAAQSLGTSTAAMQMTVSLYIAGLAGGQLVYGPLADRYGRRPVLLVGLLLYTLAGLAAALATSVDALIVARVMQALGGCAGLVLGRTMVRDTSGFEQSARRLALMNMMVTLGPGAAPLLGSLLVDSFGWRAVPLVLAGVGGAVLAYGWWTLPETGRLSSQPPLPARELAREYLTLLRSPAFLGYSLGGGSGTTAVYAFIAAAPFIFVHQLGRSVHEAGAWLALLISGVWLGSLLATRLVQRVPLQRLLLCASSVAVLGAATVLLLACLGRLSVAGVVGPMFLFTTAAGVASPAALTSAISINRRVVGSASGLYGFVQMTMGAVCTALATLGSDPAIASAAVLVGAGIVGQVGYWVAGATRSPASSA